MRPSRRELLLGGAGALAACGPREPSEPPAPDPFAPQSNGRRPRNVVMILTDDQRFDSFGFMGHPFLKTPHMDRVAAQGAWCKNSFVTTSLCCPSRATMLSGVYAHAHDVINNQSELSPRWPTYSMLMQRAGYDTAYIGKWHMGAASADPRPGWSRWIGFRGQGHYTYPGPSSLEPLDRGFNFDGEHRQVHGYVTDLLTDYAVDYVRDHEGKRPFCLVVGHKACHAPFEPAPRHRALYAEAEVPAPLPNTDEAYEGLPRWLRRQRETIFGVDHPYGQWDNFRDWYLDYHRALGAVDEGVGRLLAALQDKGILENTLFLYVSDNGFMHGEKGTLDKRCFYETSARIPILAWAPGLVEGGREVAEFVLNLDLAPTMLDAMGLAPAPTMQGASALPLLAGEPVEGWRRDFLYEYFFERRFPSTPTVIGLRSHHMKLLAYHGVWESDELYDLSQDPEERNNLIRVPAYAAKRNALRRRLREQMATYGLDLNPDWSDLAPPG